MKKRIVSALLALVLILSNFTGGGLIEHVHVEAAGETVTLFTKTLKDDYTGAWKTIIPQGETSAFIQACGVDGTIVTITTPGVASHSWLNLILQNSKSYVVVDGGTISGSTYTVAGANVVKAWEDNNITDGEWYQICLQGGTAADPACDIIVTVTAAASDSDIVFYNLEKTPDESVIIADGLESNSDTWGSPVLFDHRNVGNLKAYLDRDLYIKVIVDKGSVPQKLGIQHNVNYGYMYEYPITDGPYAVDDEKEAYYVSIKDWMAGYAEQEIPLDNSEPDKGSAENVGNVKVIGACTIYGFQVVIKGSAEPIPEPEPTYKPELDEYTVILGSTDNDKNTTDLSASEKTMFAQSYGGNFDNAVKSHLASMTEDQYIKIVVNNGALTSLYFSDWIEIPGDNKNYVDVGDIKVPLGDIYIGETGSKGNIAYYIPYSVVQTMKTKFKNDFNNICSMYATGTGTVTWIGVVEPPATEPEETVHPDREVVLSLDNAGFPYNDNQPHTFEIKTLQEGETVKIHFIGETNSDFRVMLSEGGWKRSSQILVYPLSSLEGGKFDIVVDLTVENIESSIANSIQFKGNSTLSDFKLTHLGIVYPAVKEHPDWEDPEADSIAITAENCGNKAVTVEDGAFVTHANVKDKPEDENSIAQALIKLPKPVVSGQKISVHVVGTQPEGTVFRIWPSDGGDGNDASGQTSNEIRDVEFDYRFTYTFTGSKTNYLSIKGGIGQNVMEGVKITHIAVKYYDLECDPAEQYPSLTTDNIVTGKGDERITSDGSSITVTNTEDAAGNKLIDVGIGIEKIVVKCGDTYRVHIRGTASDNFRIRVSTDGYNDEIVDNWDTVTVGEDGSFDGFFDLVIGDKDKVSKLNGAEIIPVQIHIKGKDYNAKVPDSLVITHLGVVYPEAHEHNYEYTADPDADTHTGVCSDCYAKVTEPHNWGAGVPNTDEGHIDFTCPDCGATKQEELEHVHTGDGEWKSDEDSHWLVCTDPKCPDGGIYGKESHTYENGVCTVCRHEHAADAHTPKAGTYKSNGDTHTYVCDVCGATVTEGHKIVKVSDDPSGHYDKCEFCDYQTKPEPHTGEYKYEDFTNHRITCDVCGYTGLEAHTPGEKYEDDDTARYHLCTKCGGRCDRTNHKYVAKPDENGETHHEECATCGHVKTGSTVKHTYEDGVCSACKYVHPEDAHEFDWKSGSDPQNHTGECKICHKKVTAPHNFGDYTYVEGGDVHTKTCEDCGYSVSEKHQYSAWTYADENSHVQTCECGAEKKAAHHYEYTPETITDIHHWQICSDCGHATEHQDHHYEEGSDRCSECNYWNHQHQLVWRSNDTQHWQECTVENCGYVTGREDHGFGSMTANETSHVRTCTKCGKSVIQNHQFEGYTYNSGMHWHECTVCHYKTDYEVHALTDAHDATSHWQECSVCDYETDHKAHTPSAEYGKDDTQHWSVCTECGEKYAYSEHTLAKDLKHDAEGHWKYCEVCGKEETKSDHVWDDGEITVEPTETTEGVKTYTCTECGETKTETVPKSAHKHVAGKEWKFDEKTHWHECVSETCDDKTAKLDEAAHTEDEGTVTKAATETEEGVMTFKCTVCGAVTRTESIPKVKHTHVAGKEWKHDEKTHWHECVSETCDDKTAKLDEAAHTEDEGTVTKAATETEEGVMTYKCTVCGAVTRTESIPKVTHTHVAGKEWKYDEKTHWHECVSETCDDKTAKLDEAEHVWDDGKVTVEPTYTKEGEKLYTCEVCGETKTETVPVKDHEHSTVTKSDEKGHWEECTICGEIIGEVEAHTPGEWITDSEATSTEAGKRHKECTVCGYVTDVLEVPAVGDIDVEVPTVGNVPKVELPAEQQEVLKNAIIDEEDVEAIESGASIDIELTVENAESTITPEDKAKSDEAAVQGNYTHVRYLDINLTKVVTDANGASTSEEISELGKEVRIVITVPLALAKPTGRDFAVIRVHDGEAAVLKDLDSDPNTVTISTNLFSSYTLVYVDTTPVPSTPGGLIGHVHVITGLQNDAHYHWRGCFICSMRVDYEPHRFVDGVCTVCHYRDPDYVPEVEEEEPAEAPDKEVTVVDAPAEGTEQGGDSEGTPEVTDTPADLPETEAEVVEVKEDDVTSENPKTGVVFTGIGAVMAAIAALVAKRK